MILNPTIAFVPLAWVSGVYIVVIVTSSNFILLSFISLINSLDTPYPCDTTSILMQHLLKMLLILIGSLLLAVEYSGK